MTKNSGIFSLRFSDAADYFTWEMNSIVSSSKSLSPSVIVDVCTAKLLNGFASILLSIKSSEPPILPPLMRLVGWISDHSLCVYQLFHHPPSPQRHTHNFWIVYDASSVVCECKTATSHNLLVLWNLFTRKHSRFSVGECDAVWETERKCSMQFRHSSVGDATATMPMEAPTCE